MALEFAGGSGGLYLIVYGALFLVVVLLLPRGGIPSLQTIWVKYIIRGASRPSARASVVIAGAVSEGAGIELLDRDDLRVIGGGKASPQARDTARGKYVVASRPRNHRRVRG